MGSNLPADEVQAKIAALTDSNEPLYQTVGLFAVSFGHAEHQLTRVLAHVLGYKNFEQFDFIASGMELRSKCLQLKRAATLYYPMGPNITPRIDHFTRDLRRIRNVLAHNDLLLKCEGVFCMSMGVTLDGKPDNVRPKGQRPSRYGLEELQRHALWLIDFAADLNECAESIWNGGPFEAAVPRSFLP